jgi:hypothetical protein
MIVLPNTKPGFYNTPGLEIFGTKLVEKFIRRLIIHTDLGKFVVPGSTSENEDPKVRLGKRVRRW